MLETQAQDNTSAPTPAAPAAMSDADVARLAGEAFDRVMGGGTADETPDATPEASADAPASTEPERADGRDDKGRFVARDKPADDKPAEKPAAQGEAPKDGDKPAEAAAETKPDEAAKPDGIPLAPPTSWRALGEEWGNLPRAAQEKIIAREREINAGFSDLGRKVKAYEPIGQVLGRHQDFVAQTGMDAPDLINGLIGQYQALNANPQQTLSALAREYGVNPVSLIGDNPAAAIQSIAQQYGVDLLDLVANGPAHVAPARNDPAAARYESEIAALKAEIARIGGTMSARERAERETQQRYAEAREAQVMDTITPVIAATPDWESLAPRVSALLPLVQADNPSASPAEALQAAIEQARWADPMVRNRLVADQTAAQTRQKVESLTERAAKAKAAAASNVKGASQSQPAPLTEQAEIDAVLKKYGIA